MLLIIPEGKVRSGGPIHISFTWVQFHHTRKRWIVFWETGKREWLGDFHLGGGVIPQIIPLIPAHRTPWFAFAFSLDMGRWCRDPCTSAWPLRLWVHRSVPAHLVSCVPAVQKVSFVCAPVVWSPIHTYQGTRRSAAWLPPRWCVLSLLWKDAMTCGWRERNPVPPGMELGSSLSALKAWIPNCALAE